MTDTAGPELTFEEKLEAAASKVEVSQPASSNIDPATVVPTQVLPAPVEVPHTNTLQAPPTPIIPATPRRPDVLDDILPVSEAPPALKVLLYGTPEAGKTTMCADAPNPLYIDVEGGTLSLLNFPQFQSIPKIPYTGWEKIEQLMWKVKAGDDPRIADRETYIFDTFSELQRRHLDHHLIQQYARDQTRSAYLPQGNDYNENTQVLRRMLLQWCDLDKNVVFICHDRTVQDAVGRTTHQPQMTDKLLETFVAKMDVIGFMTKQVVEGETKRFIQTVDTDVVMAKRRLNSLPDVMVNPTFNDFIEAKKLQLKLEAQPS